MAFRFFVLTLCPSVLLLLHVGAGPAPAAEDNPNLGKLPVFEGWQVSDRRDLDILVNIEDFPPNSEETALVGAATASREPPEVLILRAPDRSFLWVRLDRAVSPIPQETPQNLGDLTFADQMAWRIESQVPTPLAPFQLHVFQQPGFSGECFYYSGHFDNGRGRLTGAYCSVPDGRIDHASSILEGIGVIGVYDPR